MRIDSLQKAEAQVKSKHKCPICAKEDHNWQQVYTEINSQLNKIEKVYISWCQQQKDYVLISN